MNFMHLGKRCAVAIAVSIAGACLHGCSSGNPVPQAPVRPSLLNLAITEIQYHPLDDGLTDGDEFEFIEIKNNGDSTVALDNVAFSDGIDYAFSASDEIGPDSFVVLASNSTEFSRRYGFLPDGVYTGKLSNAGEKVSLKDLIAGNVFLSVEYGDGAPWPAAADGGGRSLVPLTVDRSGDADDPSYWRASFAMRGSPGKDDPGVVYVNEALTHTDPPLSDAIELYNPNNAPVDISGWFLTDRKVDPVKFCIPGGTVIAATGYVVFTAAGFNAAPGSPSSFSLDAHGEEVYLSSDSTGYRGGYCHGFRYGEIENGISFGRHVTSTGEERFVAQKETTVGSANAGPRVGPVIISEIMYNPANGRDEYIEIKNAGAGTVTLYDTVNPGNTWKIDGIGFSFPRDVSLKQGEVALVVANALAAAEFRSLYGVDQSVQIFTKSEDLSNSRDTLRLLKPEEPYIDSSGVPALVVPYMTVDEVIYSDGAAWPGSADGNGSSLTRKTPAAYGDDPEQWSGSIPSPGK